MPRLALLALLLLLSACGSGQQAPTAAAPTASPTPPPVPPPRFHPTPFTAEQIRDASPVGRQWHFEVESAGQTTWSTMEVVRADARGMTIRRTARGSEGQAVGEPIEGTATWAEYRDHARFPASVTAVGEERVETAAGSFDCTKYVREEDGGRVSTFWFAASLPGPPVLQEVTREGERIELRRLMRHVAGR